MGLSLQESFQILGVPEDASPEEVRQAYRDLAVVWHPDRFSGNPRLEARATEMLKQINAAYGMVKAFHESRRETGTVEAHPDPPRTGPEDAGADTSCNEPVRERRRSVSPFLAIALGLALALSLGAFLYAGFKERRPQAPVTVSLPREPAVTAESPPRETGSPKPSARTKQAVVKPRPSDKKPLSPERSFTLGSSKDEVLAVEGAPAHVSENRWGYGSSYVDFVKGRVSGWYSSSLDPLRVKMTASGEAGGTHFTAGSTKDMVLAIEGTPMRISGNRWSYGFSYVDFVKGRVSGWYSSSLDPLRVKMTASKDTGAKSFTLGSSKDEVLAAQGTPTRLSEERWSYGYSYVDFEKNRVVRWYNSERDPLFVGPEPGQDR